MCTNGQVLITVSTILNFFTAKSSQQRDSHPKSDSAMKINSFVPELTNLPIDCRFHVNRFSLIIVIGEKSNYSALTGFLNFNEKCPL